VAAGFSQFSKKIILSLSSYTCAWAMSKCSLASQLYVYIPMSGLKEQRKVGERIFLFPSAFSIHLWEKIKAYLWDTYMYHLNWVGMFTQRVYTKPYLWWLI